MEKDTRYIMLGIAVLVGMVGIIIGNHSSFESDLKALEPVPREKNVALSVLTQSEGEQLEPVSQNIPENAKLAFQITTGEPIYMSLLVAENNQPPEVLIKSARMPPGINKQLDNEGVRYIYQVQSGKKAIKFCVLYADDRQSLRQLIINLEEEWPQIPKPQCVHFP